MSEEKHQNPLQDNTSVQPSHPNHSMGAAYLNPPVWNNSQGNDFFIQPNQHLNSFNSAAANQPADHWQNWSNETNYNTSTNYHVDNPPTTDPWQWTVGQQPENKDQWTPSQLPNNPNLQSQFEPSQQFHANQTQTPFLAPNNQTPYDPNYQKTNLNQTDPYNQNHGGFVYTQQQPYYSDTSQWESWDGINQEPQSTAFNSPPIFKHIPQKDNSSFPSPPPQNYMATEHLAQTIGFNELPEQLSTSASNENNSDPNLPIPIELGREIDETMNFGVDTTGDIQTNHPDAESESQLDEPNQEVLEPVNVLDVTSVEEDSSTITTISKLTVIQSREGGPFQPPLPKNNMIRKELTEAIESMSDLKLVEGSPEVVNLEAEPDNLEQPPANETLKPDPHQISLHRQHFTKKLDESVGETKLWEYPKLPNIHFLPVDQSKSPSLEARSVVSQAPSEKVSSSTVNSTEQGLSTLPVIIKSQCTTELSQPMPVDLSVNKTNPQSYPSLENENSKLKNSEPDKERSPHRSSSESKEQQQNISYQENYPQHNRGEESFDTHYPQQYDQEPKGRFYGEFPGSRNSRPSSQGSENPKDSYSRQKYDSYPPSEHQRIDYYQHRNQLPIHSREGTPNRDFEIENRRELRDSTYLRDQSHFRDPDMSRDPRNMGYPKQSRDQVDPRISKDLRQVVNHIDVNYHSDSRDLRDSRELRDPRHQHREENLHSRSNQPHYEYDRHTRGVDDDYYNRNNTRYRGQVYGYDYYQPQTPYPMYYGYYNNYPMTHNYGYYDELYRSDPARYQEQLEQYRSYYAQRQRYDADRSSNQSGRSSVNEELKKDSYQKEYDTSSEYSGYQASLTYDGSLLNPTDEPFSLADSVASDPILAARLTPAKFSCAHPVARLYPGRLLALLPISTQGDASSLELHDLQTPYQDDIDYVELKTFQGPLINGQTHKNDVIHFCQLKIQNLEKGSDIIDRDSQILLWELLTLMLRQNGNVSGSDIAELLLKDRKSSELATSIFPVTKQIPVDSICPEDNRIDHQLLPSVSSSQFTATPLTDKGTAVSRNQLQNPAPDSALAVEQITQKFTEYLLFGNKKDALEWATKNGLWGHALFLASKMDTRSYAKIMTHFANSLRLNDPLQTLYQLMSGRQPSAVTRVADEKWGDWRPHLAMILSNLSSQPDLDRRSITTLGDTLAQRGCLSAAHFCYIMAQVEFGRYDNKTSKVVLLTSSHNLPFNEFSCNEAIQCTEIYEYAQSLANPNFILPHLQPYKFLYATRLLEHGFLQEALHYCEVLTSLAVRNPAVFSFSLLSNISQLSWRLKHEDPHYTQCQGELEEISDPEWISTLAHMLLEQGAIQTHELQAINESFPPHASEPEGLPLQGEIIPSYDWSGSSAVFDNSSWSAMQPGHNSSLYGNDPNVLNTSVLANGGPSDSPASLETSGQYETPLPSVSARSSFDYYGATTQPQAPPLSSRARQDSFGSYGRRDSQNSSSSVVPPVQGKTKAEPVYPQKDVKSKPQAGRSWLGGIFSKLLPKGPNQMILPDDKNPSIVWDASSNKWVNTIDSDVAAEPPPPLAPPKDSEIFSPAGPLASHNGPMAMLASSAPSSMPQPPPPGVNRFQRQKLKGSRQNYVDVLNLSGGKDPPSMTSMNQQETLFPTFDQVSPPSSLFVPSVNPDDLDHSGDFLSSAKGSDPILYSDNMDTRESNSFQMFDPAEFSTAPKVVGDVSGSKRTLGGYNLLSRRTYPN